MPKQSVYGYTNLNLDGLATLQTGVLVGITLASGDVVLTNDQMVNGRFEVTTGHASNAIVIPAVDYAGKLVVLRNNHATLAANIKVAGGTAVPIAATKSAILQVNGTGTEIVRVTADA